MATDKTKQALFAQATQHTSQAIAELYALRGLLDSSPAAFKIEDALGNIRVAHSWLMSMEAHFAESVQADEEETQPCSNP